MERAFFNEALDVTVRFTSSTEFVVLGDDKKVSDNTLLALSIGSLPEGWERVNSADAREVEAGLDDSHVHERTII